MPTWRDQVWPLVLVFVFFILPVGYEWTRPLYFGTQSGRATAVVVLFAGLLLGTAAAGFLVLRVGSGMLRRRSPTDLARLRREHNYAMLAAGFLVATIVVTLVLYSPVLDVAYVLLLAAYLAYSLPASRRRDDYTVAVTVARTPAEAFGFVSDARNWPRFLADVEVLPPVDVPLRAGSVVRQRITVGGHVATGEDQVTVVDPGRRLGLKTPMAPDVEDDAYEFAEVPQGTEITYRHHSLMPATLALAGGVLKRKGTQQLLITRRQDSLQRIKEILEAAPAPTV